MHALLGYAAVTGSGRHRDAAEAALRNVRTLAERVPRFAGWSLAAAEAALAGPLEVAVVGRGRRPGPGGAGAGRPGRRAAPGCWSLAGEPDDGAGATRIPLLAGRGLVEGRAAGLRVPRDGLRPAGDHARGAPGAAQGLTGLDPAVGPAVGVTAGLDDADADPDGDGEADGVGVPAAACGVEVPATGVPAPAAGEAEDPAVADGSDDAVPAGDEDVRAVGSAAGVGVGVPAVPEVAGCRPLPVSAAAAVVPLEALPSDLPVTSSTVVTPVAATANTATAPTSTRRTRGRVAARSRRAPPNVEASRARVRRSEVV